MWLCHVLEPAKLPAEIGACVTVRLDHEKGKPESYCDRPPTIVVQRVLNRVAYPQEQI